MMRLAITALIAFAVAHCGAYQSTSAKLKDTAYRYNEAVRWQNYKSASRYVEESIREKYLEERRNQASELKVLDYEIVNVRQVKTNEEAEIQVRFTWHRLPSTVVQKKRIMQIWLYGKNRKWWFVRQEEVKEKKKPSSEPLF
jgi:hypothetical protein